MKTKNRSVKESVSIQSWLRPALTAVRRNKDYLQFQEQLSAVDSLLRQSHLESMAMDFAKMSSPSGATPRRQKARVEFSLKALRVEALRMLLGNPSFRQFSRTVAASDLLADFCGVRRIDGIRGISKSTLERASKFFTADQVRWMKQVLTEMSGHEESYSELGLNEPMQTGECLVDTTCLEATIHFPIDWVLLRDVALTLLKAIKLIRKRGLLQRMPEDPEAFARKMNRLCIEMTHTRRRDEVKRARKRVLRKMKPLLKTIAEHALRHRDKLASDYGQTELSLVQARRIIARIDAMLAQVPAVIKQAHERLIGGRQVDNAEKIISVYEPDVQVIVRGKAGKNVEFGNTLFLAESPQGLILDWELFRDAAPAEWRQLQESIKRQKDFDVSVELGAACGDRGFSSRSGAKELTKNGIYDAVCPRQAQELAARMKEPRFATLQKRRACTEARIATLKHRQSRRLRCKGFDNRYLSVAWSVLGHNLWIVARFVQNEKLENKIAA